jgi:hypothetical protein
MNSSRPKDASIEALRACLTWLDACVKLGWRKSDLPKLESLWWTYHDKDGNKIESIKAKP